MLGTEGNGCCPLNCSHVYGYTTLLERLYPELAKDMRISDFIRNFNPACGVMMRYGIAGWAIDGALASVIMTDLVVREDDPTLEFLATVWPNVKVCVVPCCCGLIDCQGVSWVCELTNTACSLSDSPQRPNNAACPRCLRVLRG